MTKLRSIAAQTVFLITALTFLLAFYIPSHAVAAQTEDALRITVQPVDASAQDGKLISVSVEAEGEDPTYQWYYRNAGSAKFSKSSITSATYTTRMRDTADGRLIYCVVTDRYG